MGELRVKLSHVAIPAPDIAASLRFYELLGARPGFVRADASGRPVLIQLHFADTFIELLAEAPAVGGGHFAFTTDNIDKVWALLDSHGYAPLKKPVRGLSGVMWFFVHDPAGNPVEITMPIDQQ